VYANSVADSDLWLQLNKNIFYLEPGREKEWTISQLGQIVLFNHPDLGAGFMGDPTQQGFALLLPFDADRTWEDINLKCHVMRTHKNFIIAMNLEGSEESPNGYRISTAADIDGLPYTWDETDRSGLAIRAQLGSDGGEILDGRSLRDEFCMYSRNSIDLLAFSANNPLYWQRRELSSTVGILNTHCLSEVKGTHYLIVDGDIVMNDGSNIRSIIDGRLRQRFNSKITQFSRLNSFSVRNDFQKEVWFCVPEDGAEYPTVAYVYNWANDTFSLRDLPEQTRHADYGADPTTAPPESLGTWHNAVGKWENGSGSWGGLRETALSDKIMALTKSGELKDVDPKDKIDEADFNTVVERTSYPLDGHRQTNTVTRVYPHASGDKFKIQVGAQQYASGPVVWSTERDFDPDRQRKIDVRITGEAFAWRVKSIAANRFVFSGMDVEFVPAGVR
jgi:hypothetical protein